MGLDLLLADAKAYRFLAQTKCNAHYHMCRIYQRRHNWVGIPAVIATTIVGTTIFTGLSDNAQDWRIRVAAGMLALLAVILSSLQAFLNLPALSAQHKDAAAKYEAIRHDLDDLIRTLEISPPPDDEVKTVLKALHGIAGKMNKASQEAPSIRSGVYDRAKRDLKGDMLFRDVAADGPDSVVGIPGEEGGSSNDGGGGAGRPA